MATDVSRSLAWMFVLAAANVVAVGYYFARTHAGFVVLACTLTLAALGRWFATARHAAPDGQRKTLRRLTVALGVGLAAVAVLRIVLTP